MSILIKGMEMPKSGTYEVSIDNTNGKDKTIMSMFLRGSGGLICCGVYEIVPVSPHGDLIDRDKLEKDIDKYIGGEESRSRFHHWVQVQRAVIHKSEEAHT